MITLRLWVPAQARARFTAAVVFPTPSLGPEKTTTRPPGRGAEDVEVRACGRETGPAAGGGAAGGRAVMGRFAGGSLGMRAYLTISKVTNRKRDFCSSSVLVVVKNAPMMGILPM
jgi:hypothetical protein